MIVRLPVYATVIYCSFTAGLTGKRLKIYRELSYITVQVDPVIIYGVDCFIVNPSTVFLCPKSQKPDFTDLTIVYHGGLIIHDLDFPADLVN